MAENGILAVEALSVTRLARMSAGYNPRTMTPPDLAALRRSMREFGTVEPIICNRRTDRIVGGHQRVRAAQAEGMDRLPVVWVDLDEAGERTLNLALNRIVGRFEEGALADVLRELRELGGDLGLSGFTEGELADLLDVEPKDGKIDPNAVPADVESRTKRGDLWILGEHRLLCGDSTNGNYRDMVLGSDRPTMVWSDPPYGLGGYAGRSGKFDAIEGDDAGADRLAQFYGIGEAAELYLCCEFRTYSHLLSARGIPRSLIVWVKQNFGMGSGYRRQHEFIGYYGSFQGTTESDVWKVDRDAVSDYEHPTQKPVELVHRALKNSTCRGDVVFDPFVGSGTSLIAAEQLERRCLGIELEPKYCDVAVTRWERFTGRQADQRCT